MPAAESLRHPATWLVTAWAWPLWRVVLVALLMGGGNFAVFFVGLKTATPSAAAVVLQLGVPMTTLLSWLILGEKLRWRRGIGIALTFTSEGMRCGFGCGCDFGTTRIVRGALEVLR